MQAPTHVCGAPQPMHSRCVACWQRTVPLDDPR